MKKFFYLGFIVFSMISSSKSNCMSKENKVSHEEARTATTTLIRYFMQKQENKHIKNMVRDAYAISKIGLKDGEKIKAAL